MDRGLTRRVFLQSAALAASGMGAMAQSQDGVADEFFVRSSELELALLRGPCERRLSFANHGGTYAEWSRACRAKLAELLGYKRPDPATARLLRDCRVNGVTVEAWVMRVNDTLSLPAYLLVPDAPRRSDRAVVAIHGHGDVRALVGSEDDYHHRFGLHLARAGHLVLCPALRGFGPLWNMTSSDPERDLDYWWSERGRQFTLVTDAFIHGGTLLGETAEDLVRWEDWLARERGVRGVSVAGISYGGDLAIIYPALSRRVERIYCSGSMGSFSGIFSVCYNAPAHCVPGILDWMDRSDIAGLNAPRPMRLQYGELDTPGPGNNSAALNETVVRAHEELRAIYAAAGARDNVSMRVTPGVGHEMDLDDLRGFLDG